MNEVDKKRILAGYVRNFLAASSVIFAPFDGLDLSYRDGYLCKAGQQTERTYLLLFDASLVYDLTDDEIWKRVME